MIIYFAASFTACRSWILSFIDTPRSANSSASSSALVSASISSVRSFSRLHHRHRRPACLMPSAIAALSMLRPSAFSQLENQTR